MTIVVAIAVAAALLIAVRWGWSQHALRRELTALRGQMRDLSDRLAAAERPTNRPACGVRADADPALSESLAAYEEDAETSGERPARPPRVLH